METLWSPWQPPCWHSFYLLVHTAIRKQILFTVRKTDSDIRPKCSWFTCGSSPPAVHFVSFLLDLANMDRLRLCSAAETFDVRCQDHILWIGTCVSASFQMKPWKECDFYKWWAVLPSNKGCADSRISLTVSHFCDLSHTDITVTPYFSLTVKSPDAL